MTLRSLGTFGTLATSAYDTARSTFKGLAEAAVAGGEAGEPKAAESAEATAETRATAGGRRSGTLLDAYA